MRRLLFLSCGLGWALWEAALGGGQAEPATLQEAESHLARGQFQEAIALLRQEVARFPRDVRAHNLLGIALTAAGQPAEGNRHFEESLAIAPDFYPARKNLALNELKLGEVEKAEKHLRQVLQHAPQDPVVHLYLAEIHFSRREYEPAVRHYQESGDLPARDGGLTLRFARSCFESNQPRRAALLLRRLPEGPVEAHFQAGLMLAQLGEFAASAQQFERAIRQRPDFYDAGYNLVLAHFKNREYGAAVQVAEDLLSRGHATAELYNLLSQAYEADGRTLEAYNALKKATQIDPRDETNYLDLIVLCVDHANYDLALEIAGIGLDYLPGSTRLLLQRGAVQAFKGHYEKAVEDFQRVVAREPESNLAHYAMSMALMQLDRMQEAIEILRRKAQRGGADYLIFYALGESLNRAGATRGTPEAEEAIQVLRRSLELNPRFSPSRTALGKILLKLGDLEGAVAELEKALELDPEDLSPAYPLAQALRRRGEVEQAEEWLKRYQALKEEERDQLRNRTLVRILRADTP